MRPTVATYTCPSGRAGATGSWVVPAPKFEPRCTCPLVHNTFCSALHPVNARRLRTPAHGMAFQKGGCSLLLTVYSIVRSPNRALCLVAGGFDVYDDERGEKLDELDLLGMADPASLHRPRD